MIHCTTFIAAPVERVFDLSRSIDLHKRSMQAYGEKPVAGTLTGLLHPNETVTWQAKHLLRQRVRTVRLAQLEAPHFFVDEQLSGDFKNMRHEHYFKPCENGTIMIDRLYYQLPHGVFGSWFNALFLKSYLEKLLTQRNDALKKVAESNQWKQYLIK